MPSSCLVYVFVGCLEMYLAYIGIYAEHAICYHQSVHLSIRVFVTQLVQSKMVEVRIIQFSLFTSHIPPSFCGISFIQKFWQVPLSGGIKQGWYGENELFSSFMRQYLEKVYIMSKVTILVTNRKLHMRFQFAPRLMTLDDLELLQILRDFTDFGSNNG